MWDPIDVGFDLHRTYEGEWANGMKGLPASIQPPTSDSICNETLRFFVDPANTTNLKTLLIPQMATTGRAHSVEKASRLA